MKIRRLEKEDFKNPWSFVWLFVKFFWVRALIVILLGGLSLVCSFLITNVAIEKFTEVYSFFKESNFSFQLFFDKTTPVYWIIIFGVSLIASEIIYYLSRIFSATIVTKVEYTARLSLFRYVEGLSTEYFSRNGEGFIENYIDNIADALKEIPKTLIQDVIPSIMFILSTVGYFFSIHLYLGSSLLIFLILHISIFRYLSRSDIENSRKQSIASNRRTSAMNECLKNIIASKIFRLEDYCTSRIDVHQTEETNLFYKYLTGNSFVVLVASMVGIIYQIVLVAILLPFLYKTGAVSIEGIAPIISINFVNLYIMWDRSKEMVEVMQSFSELTQSLSLIYEAPTDFIDGVLKPELDGSLKFRNFGFTTKSGKTLFRNFSCDIKPGTTISLVGASGSGKSTILNVLAKLVQCNSEQLFLHNYDITTIDPNYIREHVGYVSQKDFLFDTSIYENIIIGNKDAKEEDVVIAAKEAGIHDFVMTLPEKYQTRIGSNASFISGGQAQRICIARVLIGKNNWSVLLADEITSALDTVTGRSIMNNLIKFCKDNNKTLICSTHADYVSCIMDKVMFINRYKEIEFDSHANLMKLDSEYKAKFDAYLSA